MQKLQGFVDEACVPVKEREYKEYKETSKEKFRHVDRENTLLYYSPSN